MFHLVFRSPRHKQNYHYLRRKTNKSSTHNQFELNTIRSAIKSRWRIIPYTTWDIQQIVWSAERTLLQVSEPTFMHGHIIEVESPSDAIWFRLNSVNVSKNGCKLVELYSGLDFDIIREKANKVELAGAHKNKIHSFVTSLRWGQDRVENTLSTFGMYHGNNEINNRITRANIEIKNIAEYIVEQHEESIKALTEQTDGLFDYLRSKRTLVE